MKSKERSAAFTKLMENNRISQVLVEDIKQPFYIKSEDMQLLDKIVIGKPPTKHASILAPLDNLIWDRKLIKELFDFEYRWEVYKPASERSYGYYVLPVLYGDNFVARFEPGRNKKTNTMIIKNWWWEPKVKPNQIMKEELRRCFKEFINFMGAEHIRIENKTSEINGLDWLK